MSAKQAVRKGGKMTYKELEVSVSSTITMRGRQYKGGDRTPILCLHGLTRNAQDLSDLAPKLPTLGHDVFAMSFRGRGASDRDPEYLNYHPQTYCDDVLTLLDTVGAPNAVFLGTSLGGIVTMLLNAARPDRVKGAVLNDVGPEPAPEGIMRIAGYVGVGAGPVEDLEAAAARIKEINAVAFPDATAADWQLFAERTFRQTPDGKWELDYDPNIARALMELGPAPDLWPAFKSLKNTPTLIVRGMLSDLLTPPIIDKMREAHPAFDYVEVPRVGHAPMMTEPTAWDAIETFLKTLD